MTLLLSLVLACGGAVTPAPVSPEAPPVVHPAAEAPSPGSGVAMAGEPTVGKGYVIQLLPDLLTYDDAAGTALFSPDSRRQTSHYTEFLLDTKSLEAVAGGRPIEPVWLVVELSDQAHRTVVPQDPNLPAPDGGFQYTTWTGKVTALSTDQ